MTLRRLYALQLERGFARELETARAEASAVVMWRAARRLRLVRWVLGLPLSAELRATRPCRVTALPEGIEECEDNDCAGCPFCDLFANECADCGADLSQAGPPHECGVTP